MKTTPKQFTWMLLSPLFRWGEEGQRHSISCSRSHCSWTESELKFSRALSWPLLQPPARTEAMNQHSAKTQSWGSAFERRENLRDYREIKPDGHFSFWIILTEKNGLNSRGLGAIKHKSSASSSPARDEIRNSYFPQSGWISPHSGCFALHECDIWLLCKCWSHQHPLGLQPPLEIEAGKPSPAPRQSVGKNGSLQVLSCSSEIWGPPPPSSWPH